MYIKIISYEIYILAKPYFTVFVILILTEISTSPKDI